jgi:hypothetical protein
MFECAILTRPAELEVLHEPFVASSLHFPHRELTADALHSAGETWYYSKERVSDRFTQEECEKSGHLELNFKKVRSSLSTLRFRLPLTLICFKDLGGDRSASPDEEGILEGCGLSFSLFLLF